MKNLTLITAAGLLTYGVYLLTQDQTDTSSSDSGAADLLDAAGQGTYQLIDQLTGGTMKLSNMAAVTVADLNHPNVRAMLAVIRQGEGTSGPNGYRTMFGGALFDSFADHPRRTITRNGYTSSAAGAYQFLASTWDETARIMGLGDFSPASQDRAAVGLLAKRNALQDTRAGRFDLAIQKIGKEWASMPGSPYGQPVISLDTARNTYANHLGTFA